MQQLEDEVSRLASLPDEQRLAGGSLVPFTKLVGLIHRLVDTAESVVDAGTGGSSSGNTDSRFFVFIERAESWCDSLSDFVPAGKSGVLVSHEAPSAASASSGTEKKTATPLIVVAHEARLRTFGAARDAYRRGEQWGMCLRYAERVDAVNRAVLGFYERATSLPSAEPQIRAAIAAATRSTLSVGGLQSKLDRHNTALEQTRAAVQLITPLLQKLSAEHSALVADGNTEAASRAQQELINLGALRVAALYSTAAELEHLDRPQDAQPLLQQALHAATVESPLPSGHPLVAKIEEALHGYESDRSTSVASSVLAGARSGRVGRSMGPTTQRTPRKSSQKRSGSGRRQLQQTEPSSARKPPGRLPPTGAPPRTADPSSYSARAASSDRAPSGRVPQPPPPRTTTAPTGGAHGGRRPQPLSATAVMQGATFTSSSSDQLPPKSAFAGSSTGGAAKAVPPLNTQPLFPNDAQRPPRAGVPPRPQQQGAPSLTTSQGATQPVTMVAHLDEDVVTPGDVEPMNTINVARAGVSPTSIASRATPGMNNSTGMPGSRPVTKNGANSRKTPGAGKSGASAVVETMRDRELQLRRRYLNWVASERGPIQAQFDKRCRAALTIQCAWRCARARLNAFNRRQVLYHFYHQLQKAAAEAILAKYRTFVAKRDARRRIAAIRSKRAEIAARERVERKAVLVIQRAMTTYVLKCRREAELLRLLQLEQAAKLKQYDTAAVIVQRWWPLAKEQRAYWQQRNVELEEVRRIEGERLRKHTAATDISRTFRGHRARVYAREFREAERERKRKLQLAIRGSIDAIRIFLREVRARKERLVLERDLELRRRDTAAARIQHSWGRSLQREHMHLVAKRGRMVKASAARIQRCYRRFRARRDLRVLRTVGRTQAMIRVEREWKQERAARRLQCAWRQNLARKCVRAVKASYGRKLLLATWLLQRVGRGFATRHEEGMEHALRVQLIEHAMREAFRRRERLAALIQGACRAALSVAEGTARKEAVEAEELLIVRRTRREIFEDGKATKIQSLVRGHRGRGKARDHAELLRSCEIAILQATVRLQCFFRKTLARRELHSRQVAAWKLHKKRQLMAEVANELFASRVDELSRLEHASRSAIASKERGRTLMLLSKARRIGWPVHGVLDVAAGPSETPDNFIEEDDADGYDIARRRRSAFDELENGASSNVAGSSSNAVSERADAIVSGKAQQQLELQESRARNAMLRQEVKLFVAIFVELQREAPALPDSATPGEEAYPVAESCPYDGFDDDDDDAEEEEEVVEKGGAGQNNADAPASAPPPAVPLYGAERPPNTAESIPHGADLDDLLAAPPDATADGAATTAASSATLGFSARGPVPTSSQAGGQHMQDAYDAHYGIAGTYGADEEAEEDDEDDSDGLYD